MKSCILLVVRDLLIVACVAVLLLIAGETGAQGIQWRQVHLGGRMYHAMSYDTARGVTVLFGGRGGSSTNASNSETWEWNGRTWLCRAITGPSARATAAMAYDGARSATVLFGGLSDIYSDETWIWNGTVWTRRAVSGPSARASHRMVYDSERGVIVLFGGFRYQNSTRIYDAETWEWDGEQWTQRIASGPSPRSGHMMVYDAARNVTVVYGGGIFDGATTINNSETWEWDGVAWTQRAIDGPPACSNQGMAFDSLRGVTVLTCIRPGSAGESETWEWDGTVWTQRTGFLVVGRSSGAMVYDIAHRTAMFFGGVGSSDLFVPSGQMWGWDGNIWTLLGNSSPTPRVNHAMSFDSQRGIAVMFGGEVVNAAGPNNDTWEWNGIDWTKRLMSGPTPRRNASMVYDSAREESLLFGGESGGSLYADTWGWNGSSWTRRAVSGPSPRRYSAMAYDSLRGIVVLSGGISGSSSFGDTWEWNGQLWTQHANSVIFARYAHGMTFDDSRGVTVLFGGVGISGRNAETWEWNGAAWTRRLVNGPVARSSADLVYDASRSVVVLYGGTTDVGYSNETWHWNGVAWSQQDVAGLAPKFYPRMVYDTMRGVPMLFGGSYDQAFSDETCILGPECAAPSIVEQPQGRSACRSHAVRLQIAATGSSLISFRWRKDGQDIDVVGNRSANTAMLLLTDLQASDSGLYDCVLTSPCGNITSVTADISVCAADFNCDQFVDLFDYLDFVSLFAASDAAADFNADSVVDFFDYLDFLSTFAGGC